MTSDANAGRGGVARRIPTGLSSGVCSRETGSLYVCVCVCVCVVVVVVVCVLVGGGCSTVSHCNCAMHSIKVFGTEARDLVLFVADC